MSLLEIYFPKAWIWAGAVASIAMGRRDSGLVKGWGRPFTMPRPGFFGGSEGCLRFPLFFVTSEESACFGL